MSEEEKTPAFDSVLDTMKVSCMAQLISHMNGVGASVLVKYPLIEEKTWTIQKYEAEAYLASAPRDPALAPQLTRICFHHYGPPADEAQLIEQLNTKATDVKNNDIAWLEAAAFVNGLRARAQDAIEAATTSEQVDTIYRNAFAELGAFQNATGL